MVSFSCTRGAPAALLLLVVASTAARAQTTFSNTSVITIDSATAAQANPYPSTIDVSGLTSTTAKVTITLLGLTHTDAYHLQFLVEDPTGRRLMIFSDVSNHSSVSNIDVTLDDAGGSYLPDMSGALTAGTYKPTSHYSPLDMPGVCTNCPLSAPAQTGGTLGNTFNGLNPNGMWKLYVYDWVAGNGGSLNGGWSITITTSAGLATTTTVSSSLNPSWTTGTVTLTATVMEGTNTVTQGAVTFLEGATTLAGPITLNASGQASSGALTLTEGAHIITAQYSGAGGYSPSVGQITQVVNTPTTQNGNKFCNAGTIAIPKPPGSGVDTGDPANPYPSNIFVSGLTGTTSKVTVDFTGFAHAYPANVDMILVSPLGDRSLLLWSDIGGGTSVSGRNVTLDDGAALPLPDQATSLSTGTYLPTARDYRTNHTFPAPAPQTPSLAAPRGADTLALFNGIDPNGNWKLYVVDGAMGQTGSITGGWCVTFTLSSDAATSTAVTASLNPSFTGNSVTFTATVTSGGSPVTTGTVTFKEGSTVLQGPVGLDASGQASFTTSSLGEGRHRITANYSGVPGSFNLSAGYVDQQVDDATQVSGTQFCNTADTGAMTIPAAGTSIGAAEQYPLRFFISNLPGTVNTLTVSMSGLQYTSPVALQMMLVGPGGTAAQGIDFFSHASNATPVTGIDVTFSDAAPTAVPSTALVSGTYLPTSTTAGNTWDAPAPAGPYQFAAPAGAHTLTSVFGNTDGNGVWSLYVASTSNGTSGAVTGPVCLTFTQNAPDLTISKTHAGDFRQGEIGAEYAITVTNNGPGPSGGTVTVMDTLPADLTATGISGTGWTCALGTLTCTRADALAAGSSYPPITLTVNVAGAAAASITNTATVSGGGDATPGNNTANDVTTVTAAADLTIAKSHDGDFSQGQTGASYTITVTNSGLGATISPVTVVENPPAALALTGLSGTGWTCDVPGRSCSRSDVLSAGASYPAIAATFDVAASAPSAVSNAVAVSGGGQTNTTNDSATDPTTIIQKPDLTIGKSHAGDFRQGQTGAEYTITVTNSGGSATSDTVTVTDTLPAGLTAAVIAGTGWACNLGTLSCTRSDALAAGTSYPAIVVTVNVAAGAAASITNSAAVSGGGELNTGNNTASDPTTVIQVADLTVTKTHTGDFSQGQTGAQYTITVTNSGPGPTDAAVTVTDTLPAGLTATGISGTGWSCVLGTLTCTRSDALAAGASYPAITLTANVDTNASSSVTNSATVSGGGEINTGNNAATDSTTIIQFADLTVAKSHTGNFRQGQTGAVYEVVVTNAGNAATTGVVTVTDTLPAGLTATAMSGPGWACVPATLTCTRSDALAPDAAYPPIALTVDVAAGAAAAVTNTVEVSGGGEVITTNDTASDPTTVVQVPDLQVAKSHSGNFRQGQAGAAYTLVVSNAGPGPTDAPVTVTDTLPAGLTATGIGGTGWTCNLGTLSCTRSDALAAGASYAAITVTVNVAANAPANVTNYVAVSGGGEVNAGNNTASDSTTVDQVADMTVTMTHTGSFTRGQTGAQYAIAVSNSGPGPTVGIVSMTDILPAGLTATAMSGSGWSCTLATLTCTRSDTLMSASSYPPIWLTVNVAANAPASVTNSVSISGGGELETGNNSFSDPTVIVQLADLTISKAHAGVFEQGQSGAQYTITVTNAGNGATTAPVAVVDTLPPGLTATAIGGAGWACTLATLTCTRADALGPAASYPAIAVTVDVAAGAPATVVNTATVSGGGEVITTNNSASDTTLIGQIADLRVAKSHAGNFRQRQTGAAYTIVVTNSGTGPTAGAVSVTDVLPAGLTATAMSGAGWTCSLAALTCTRADVLAAGASYPAVTLAINVAFDAAASVVNNVAVSGGGEAVTNNNTAADPTQIDQVVDVTVSTSPAGLKISVDGADYPDGHRFEWIAGSAHTLGPGASIEEPPGTRRVLVSWSDGGGTSHTVTAPAAAATYTARYTLQYALTPAVSPVEGGSITPAFEWYYDAGSTVAISAAAKPGFAFAGWTGPVKDPRSPVTQVVMSGPVSVTARFERPTGEQTIAFPPIPDKGAGDPPFAVTATASSGLPVAFRVVSGPAKIAGNLITLFGIGTVTVEASQSGDETHPPAAPVTRSFRVLETAPAYTSGAIVDAASYRQPVAPGSLASIFGMNLAPETAQAASLPLPVSLGGTWVTVIDSAGVSYSAQLLYVSAAQINFVIPEGIASGPAQVMITNESGGRTAVGTIDIAQVAPALFSVDMTGRGLAAAIFTRVAADGTVVTLPTFELTPDGRIVGVPIDLGGPDDRVFLSLFGTGIRGVSGAGEVNAMAGGLPAAVHYAGRQPEYAGLDQVNIELPAALAGRGAIDVSITAQGRASNAVSVIIR